MKELETAGASPTNNRPTGMVKAEPNADRDMFQPEPAAEGAAPARTRKPDPKVTEGHHVSGQGAKAEPYKHEVLAEGKNLMKSNADDTHVHAPTPEAHAREAYVTGARDHKETIRTDSARSTMKDALKSAKKL